jgi:signal transduction histidine kinase
MQQRLGCGRIPAGEEIRSDAGMAHFPGAASTEVTAADGVCHIDVLDHGPGIDPAIRDRIF